MVFTPVVLIVLLMSCLLALLLSLWGTPVAGNAAMRFGIVDKPDGRLKRHTTTIPYLGGLAIFTSFLVSLSVAYRFDKHLLGILLAGTIIALLGLIDDLGALSPGVKLAGQLIAVWCLINSEVRIKIAIFPLWVQIVLTILWVMAMINAVNLIDIMDGLAAGVCSVIALVLLVNALLSGNVN
ncbi:MraY family glycosyltransferase, partial [Acidobacteriota bacterium]